MHKIFVNFRSGDQDLAAPLIEGWLSEQFGDDVVFYSSKSIPAGADFPAELLSHASQCEVLLALIGPQWLTLASEDGTPLLSRQDDWVRKEIATALAANRTVVPVLIAGAPRLAEGTLPDDIAALERLESVRLRRADMTADLVHLKQELRKLLPGLRQRRPDTGRPQASIEVGTVGETGTVTVARVPEGSKPDVDMTAKIGNLHGRATVLHEYEPGTSGLEARRAVGEMAKSWRRHGLPAAVGVLLGAITAVLINFATAGRPATSVLIGAGASVLTWAVWDAWRAARDR